MKNIKKWLTSFVMTLLVLFGATAFGQTTEAKELTNVLSDIIIWDNSNGREASEKDGAYDLVIGNKYSFDTKFDLSAYNSNVEDGDFFTFTVPAPFTVKDGAKIELNDPETKVAIADAVITSNGDNQGGTVTITMKNLKEYLAKKNATDVLNVKGSFFTAFSVELEKNLTTETFTNIKDTNTKNISFKISKSQIEDNTEDIKEENFAKYGGVLNKVSWSSDILGKSGDYWHKWRIRSNTNGTTYSRFIVRDAILETGGPMQFIPETFEVTAGDGINKGWSLTNPETLVAGKDYDISFNPAYTRFELSIINPGNRRFMIDYSTTAPADGSSVGNTISISTDKGKLTDKITSNLTDLTVTRLSRIQEGGTISIETGNRITIYKTDAETGQRLGGAVFTVTKPDGSLITLDPTDETHGRTQSPVFTEGEIAAGKFTVKEVTAPAGYILNQAPVEVTVTANGAIRNITNRKASTAVPLAVTKTLTGRALKADEFEFVLTDSKTGKVVERVTNYKDGFVEFTDLTFNQAGQYVYTITETNGGQTIDNVTYDGKTITATITVTADPVTGALSHDLEYSVLPVFENVYAEPTTTTTTTTTSTTTTSTTTTTAEPSTTSTTTTTAEPTTTSTTTTTAEPTTTSTTSTTAEPTTTVATTTTAEPTTTAATTTTAEPTTVATTTTAEPTTTVATTTTAEPSTTSTTTTTAEPTTVATTTTVEPTTTVATTTVEPSTTSTTTVVPDATTSQTPPPAGKKRKILPKTGEESGLTASLIGLALMAVAGVASVLYRKSKKA